MKKPRTVIVNDRMQRGYTYALVAPVGRNFEKGFDPELTPEQMLALGIFGGKYMTDCRVEFPASWFAGAKLSPGRRDPSLNYFGVDASQPLSVWRQRMDPPRRPARLVSMVLPLLSRPPHARRGPAPDRAGKRSAAT